MKVDSIEYLVINHIETATCGKYLDSVVQLSGDCSVFLENLRPYLADEYLIDFYVANSTPEFINSVNERFKYAGTGYKTNRLCLIDSTTDFVSIVYADLSFANNTNELLEMINNTCALAAYVVLPSEVEVDPSEKNLATALKQADANLINIGNINNKSAYLIVNKSSIAGKDTDPLGTGYLLDYYSWSTDCHWGSGSIESFMKNFPVLEDSKTETKRSIDGYTLLNKSSTLYQKPEDIVKKTKNLDDIQNLYDLDREKIEFSFKHLSELNPSFLNFLNLSRYDIEQRYTQLIKELNESYWLSIKLLIKQQLRCANTSSEHPWLMERQLFKEAVKPMISDDLEYADFASKTVKDLSGQIISCLNKATNKAINHFYFNCSEYDSHDLLEAKQLNDILLPNKITTNSLLNFNKNILNSSFFPLNDEGLDEIVVPLRAICTLAGVSNIHLKTLKTSSYRPGDKIQMIGSLLGQNPTTVLTLQLHEDGSQKIVFSCEMIRNINILISKHNRWVKSSKDMFDKISPVEDFDEFDSAYNQIGNGKYTLKNTLLGDYI